MCNEIRDGYRLGLHDERERDRITRMREILGSCDRVTVGE